MSPARALRLGLARAAAQLHDLPLQVTAVQRSCLAQDDIAAACDSGMLLALLDGPEGARGAIGLDPALVAALIEVQVMGAVGTRAPEARALTPTDAAMVAPWLDAALERVDQALAEAAVDPPDRWLTGYRFGAMAEDAAALALALDAARFHLLRLTVDVALGRRIGTLLLALPAAPPVAEARPEAAVSAAESFLHVPADLRVIAGRLSLPLSRAAGSRPAICCRCRTGRWSGRSCWRWTGAWRAGRGSAGWASIGRCASAGRRQLCRRYRKRCRCRLRHRRPTQARGRAVRLRPICRRSPRWNSTNRKRPRRPCCPRAKAAAHDSCGAQPCCSSSSCGRRPARS